MLWRGTIRYDTGLKIFSGVTFAGRARLPFVKVPRASGPWAASKRKGEEVRSGCRNGIDQLKCHALVSLIIRIKVFESCFDPNT